ncbi:MAG: ATP-binding protein [Parvularculaceae bacterium]
MNHAQAKVERDDARSSDAGGIARPAALDAFDALADVAAFSIDPATGEAACGPALFSLLDLKPTEHLDVGTLLGALVDNAGLALRLDLKNASDREAILRLRCQTKTACAPRRLELKIVLPRAGAADPTVHGIARDVAREWIEADAAARSAAFLRAALDNVSDGVVACNEAGELAVFNRAAREFHGATADRSTVDDWSQRFDLFEADGETPLAEARIPLWSGFKGETVDAQEIVIAPEGLPRRRVVSRAVQMVDDEGRLLGAVATMRDVSGERAKAEELELLFQNAPARIWLKDADDVIVRLNEAAADAMGAAADAVEGRLASAFGAATPAARHEDDLDVMASGTPRLGVVEAFEDRDGGRRWASTDKVPFKDPASQRDMALVISYDITPLIEAQEKLRQSNDELEQFARVASHDLQEPLRKLTIFSQFLERDLGPDLPESARKDLETIKNSAKRMQTLIKDILRLSRMRAGAAPTRVDPCEVARKALLDYSAKCADRRVVLAFEDAPDVIAEAGLLAQVYQNLVGNALKFGVADKTRLPSVRFTAEARGGEVVLGVADNGPGVPEDHRERVFDPLTRLQSKSAAPGSGMGLAICRKAVDALGGRIWIEENAGGGAHVRFALPRANGSE